MLTLKQVTIAYSSYIGFVPINGILLAVLMVRLRPNVIENSAFIFGSSKHGKALRAFGASKSVTANHLHMQELFLTLL